MRRAPSVIYIRPDGSDRTRRELNKIQKYAAMVHLPWRYFAARPEEADRLIEDGDAGKLEEVYAIR